MNRLAFTNSIRPFQLLPRGINTTSLAKYALQFLALSMVVVFAVDLAIASVTQTLKHSRLKAKERELLSFIETQTGQTTGHISPRYEFWTPKEINQAYYGEDFENQRDVIALAKDNTIILAHGFNADAEPEVLLHELYHVVVSENKLSYGCRAEEERAAYDLQIDYVNSIGFGRKPAALQVLAMTNCRKPGPISMT